MAVKAATILDIVKKFISYSPDIFEKFGNNVNKVFVEYVAKPAELYLDISQYQLHPSIVISEDNTSNSTVDYMQLIEKENSVRDMIYNGSSSSIINNFVINNGRYDGGIFRPGNDISIDGNGNINIIVNHASDAVFNPRYGSARSLYAPAKGSYDTSETYGAGEEYHPIDGG